MGVVFAAHDLQLERKIAIKLVRPQPLGALSATDRRSWLMREARAMAQISHPNVVAVHDIGTLGDQMFIAMEYVEGKTLCVWLSEQNRSWRDVLSMFVQAGRGLAAAHSGGILHRDFKPENVLVDKHGRVRLVDFGLARLAEVGKSEHLNADNRRDGADTNDAYQLSKSDIAVTERGKFAGTPAYMAPEQLMGKPMDEKTDQYSFCVALFQGLYGSLPFSADSLGALLEQIRHSRVNETSKASDVPASLRQAVLRGLSPDPADRFPSMGVLLDQLERELVVLRRRSLIEAIITLLMSILGAFYARWGHGTRAPQRCSLVGE
jgi:serine/threonine protein kinase